MKKKLLLACSILFIGAALSLHSCDTKNNLVKAALTGKTFDAPTTDFSIPIITGVHQSFLSFDSVKVDVNIDSLIKASTGGASGIDDADKIVVKSLSLQLTDADQQNNWANLDTVNIYLVSNTSTSPTKIATVTNTDHYSDLVSGNVNSTLNAKDYLKGNQIFYIFYGTNRRATTKILHGTIDATFGIE